MDRCHRFLAQSKHYAHFHGRRSVLKVARVHFPSLPSFPFPSLSFPFRPLSLPSLPSLPFSSPPLPCREATPSNTARGLGSAVSSPARSGRKRILGAFRAQNRVWWQQCDMSHNHSLIINIHYFWWMQCIWNWMQSLNGWWTTLAQLHLQTFCEGPNNGGPLLAKFHEGPDPRTLAGSTPMVT